MIEWIFRYWHGYIKIEITGNALPRFINQLNDLGIIIWNLKRIKYDCYHGFIFVEDFTRLHSVVRKRKCRVRIIQKIGVPFLAKNIRKRFFLLIGVILFIFIFYYGSMFYWFLEVNGLEHIEKKEILTILQEEGVRRGIYKEKLDLSKLEDTFLQEIPDISWINIKWKGTQLLIDLVEKKKVVPEGNGAIVSSRDGVITQLIVLKGQPAVEEGDTVTRGQVLIVPDELEGETRGIVKADVWYDAMGTACSYDEKILTTGKKRVFHGILLGPFACWLSKADSSYSQYIRKIELKKLFIWRNIALPIELIKEEHIEINLLKERKSTQLTIFQAKEKAFKSVLKILDNDSRIEDIITDVLIDENNSTEDKKYIKVRLLLRVEENIGFKEDLSDRN